MNRLVAEGLLPVAAELRADLVPIAFGWALMKKMGVKEFPSGFELSSSSERVKVSESHVITAALGFAFGVFENGYDEIFSKKVVELLVNRSAEVSSLNKALNDDTGIDLSKISFTSSLLDYSASEYSLHAK